MIPTRCIVLPLLAGLLGCAADSVVFVTGTNVGLDIEASDGQEGVNVGYRRLEFVSMPVTATDASDSGSGDGGDRALVRQAFPVLATFEMSTGALLSTNVTKLRVRSTFATGAAATADGAARAVATVFAASGRSGDRLAPPAAVEHVGHILERLGSAPSEAQLAAVSAALLGGATLDAESFAGFVRARPVDAGEKQEMLDDAPAARPVMAHELVRYAGEDGRTADLERLADALDALEDG